MENRMIRHSLYRKLALAGALVAALSLAGVALATTPMSSHASPTAVTHAATSESDSGTDTTASTSDATHTSAVSTAAQSNLTGGPHNNHGGYVSCVARDGSNCTTANPTLPSHGQASAHSQAAQHRH
jgi:hypothetical protein